MRPKDLQIPTPYFGKEIVLDRQQKVLYLPSRFLKNDIEINLKKIFGNNNPVYLEYCSGNGEWIAQKASTHPDINWIAVEKKIPRVKKIWSKMQNMGLDNLFVICGEARELTSIFLEDQSIDHIYINFPDPWPKNKHSKNRLVQPLFLEQLYRVMKINAEVFLITDDPCYSKQMLDTFTKIEYFDSILPPPYFSTDIENYGPSYFLNLWREKKRSFYLLKFKKSVIEKNIQKTSN